MYVREMNVKIERQRKKESHEIELISEVLFKNLFLVKEKKRKQKNYIVNRKFEWNLGREKNNNNTVTRVKKKYRFMLRL